MEIQAGESLPPTVTVGIVNFNGRNYLPGCLESLAGQAGVELEIIVLDNASTDTSCEWLAESWPDIRVIRNDQNRGFGAGHNQLIQQTAGAYYLALNPDVVLKPDFIRHLVNQGSIDPDCGWACGKLLLADSEDGPTPHIYSVGHAMLQDGYAFNIGQGEADQGQFDAPREVFGANGAAVLYKRTLLADMQKHSGEAFDETMLHYFEDTDLDWRARLLGWRCCYVPQAVAYHKGDYTESRNDLRLAARGLGNRYLSAFKNSFTRDLLLRLIPLFTLHCALRIVANPPAGAIMLGQVSRHLRHIYQRRRLMAKNRRLNRDEMRRWFEWSREQQRAQPVGFRDRLRRFAGAVSTVPPSRQTRT